MNNETASQKERERQRERERKRETERKEGEREKPTKFTKHAAARKPSKPLTPPKKLSES